MDQETKKRSELQNKALHKYFELLADTFNDAGLDMKKVLKPEIDIPWSKLSVKEYIWRPVMKAQLQKSSTTELTTKEIDKVFDTINRFLSEKFGITESFPSIEEIISKQREEEDKKAVEKQLEEEKNGRKI